MANLVIPPDVFLDNYNIPLSELVDRNTFRESLQKGKAVTINYLSHAIATQLMRCRHATLQVKMKENPETGGYVFADIADSGYYMVGYIEDGEGNTSEEVYFALLTTAGLAIPRDKLTVKEINTAFARAKTKTIAMVLGIGLKLWTGADLDESIMDEKVTILNALYALADKYNAMAASPYAVQADISSSIDTIKREGTALKTMLAELSNTPAKVEVEVVEGDAPEPAKLDQHAPSARQQRKLKATPTNDEAIPF
jgi:hypothetical protein